MARDRERQCEFYICEGNCSKGRAGTFRDQCQKCDKYVAKKGVAPRRADNRKRKMEKIRKREDRY